MQEISIDGETLTLEQALSIAKGLFKAKLSSSSREKMAISRQAIENVILSDQIVYGVNTGFGSLSSVVIERNELENLQKEYGEDRYRPSPLLKRMAKENQTFY